MISLISLIAAIVSGSGAEVLPPDIPPMRGASFAPQITCQISMQYWCITNGVEIIGMIYKDGVRKWIINDKLYFNDGPLLVVENKANCSDGYKMLVSKVYDKPSGDKYLLSYSLTKESGCNLEFLIPMNNG